MNHYILKRTISGCDKPLFIILQMDKNEQTWAWPITWEYRRGDIREALNQRIGKPTTGYLRVPENNLDNLRAEKQRADRCWRLTID